MAESVWAPHDFAHAPEKVCGACLEKMTRSLRTCKDRCLVPGAKFALRSSFDGPAWQAAIQAGAVQPSGHPLEVAGGGHGV